VLANQGCYREDRDAANGSPMNGGGMKFDKNHERGFIEQMRFDKSTNTIKPHIIYPESLETKAFELSPYCSLAKIGTGLSCTPLFPSQKPLGLQPHVWEKP